MTKGNDFMARIESAFSVRQEERVQAKDPATDIDLQRLRNALGHQIPSPFDELLRLTNGVSLEFVIRGRWDHLDWIVWPCDWMVITNENQREFLDEEGYAGRDFFFFAGSDNDNFGLRLQGRGAGEVWNWNPVAGELEVLAASLDDYLQKRANETLWN